MRAIRPISYIKRKFHERKTRRKHETPEDKHARLTALATIWIAVFTVVLAAASILSFLEIYWGGADTRRLVTATENLANAATGEQANMRDLSSATQRLADSASGQAGSMQLFADRMKEQADQTKMIAEQAKIQSDNTARLASAAETANQNTLTVAQSQTRPWLNMSTLKLTGEKVDANASNFFGKTWEFDMFVTNYGNFPARRITISLYRIQEDTKFTVGNNWKDLKDCADLESEFMKDSGQSTTIAFPQQINVPAGSQSVNISNTVIRIERTPDIVACIVYQGTGTDVHHTKILYKAVRSKEFVTVPNFPKLHYWPVISYEISDTDAN